jgi:hypothetical protein
MQEVEVASNWTALSKSRTRTGTSVPSRGLFFRLTFRDTKIARLVWLEVSRTRPMMPPARIELAHAV